MITLPADLGTVLDACLKDSDTMYHNDGNAIRTELDRLVHPRARVREERLVIPFDKKINREMANVAGSKMAKLGEIRNRLNINVPQGFVITATAFERFIRLNDLQDVKNRIVR